MTASMPELSVLHNGTEDDSNRCLWLFLPKDGDKRKSGDGVVVVQV